MGSRSRRGNQSDGWSTAREERAGKKMNKRARRAKARAEREFEKMVEAQQKADKTAFTHARVRLDSVPAAISCSMHPELEGATDTFIIHSRGTSELALYFCIRCERDLLLRLVGDFLSYPGHATAMGALTLPVELVEALETLGAVGLNEGAAPQVIQLGPGPGGSEIAPPTKRAIMPIVDGD